MIEINWSDVLNVINQIRPYLIILGIVIVAAIMIAIAVKGMKRTTKYLVRTQSFVAVILVILLVANLICLGTMSTLLTLVTTPVSEITAESASNAEALGQRIAEEGIVLLQNDDNVLPLSGNTLNVFGWASAYPVYGGTGSGALSDAYHIVDLLEGIPGAAEKQGESDSPLRWEKTDCVHSTVLSACCAVLLRRRDPCLHLYAL